MRGRRKGEKEEDGKNPVCKANTVVQNLVLSVGVGPQRATKIPSERESQVMIRYRVYRDHSGRSVKGKGEGGTGGQEMSSSPY